jgi:hypothetical protein
VGVGLKLERGEDAVHDLGFINLKKKNNIMLRRVDLPQGFRKVLRRDER